MQHPADVGVVVSDMDRSLDFYTNVMGMTKVGEFRPGQPLVDDLGLTDGKPVHVVFMKFNDEPGAPRYKLVQIEGVVSPPIGESFKPGLRYLTVFVEDLAPYLKRLEERNIELINKVTPVTMPNGGQILLFQDPDGALIEVVMPPK